MRTAVNMESYNTRMGRTCQPQGRNREGRAQNHVLSHHHSSLDTTRLKTSYVELGRSTPTEPDKIDIGVRNSKPRTNRNLSLNPVFIELVRKESPESLCERRL